MDLDHLTFPPLPTKPNIGYVVRYDFSPEQRAFLAKHGIAISDGYIGMLRAYRENRTVWQTSAWQPIMAAMNCNMSGRQFPIDEMNGANLRLLHGWVNRLMALPERELTEELAVTVPYLS